MNEQTFLPPSIGQFENISMILGKSDYKDSFQKESEPKKGEWKAFKGLVNNRIMNWWILTRKTKTFQWTKRKCTKWKSNTKRIENCGSEDSTKKSKNVNLTHEYEMVAKRRGKCEKGINSANPPLPVPEH